MNKGKEKNLKSRFLLTGLIAVVLSLVLGFCFNEQVLAVGGWITGKFNKTYDFDGDYYVNVGDISSEVKTVSFWINGTAAGIVVSLNNSAYISAVGGTVSTTGFTSPTIYVDGIVGSTIDSEWHYVAVTTNTGINASAVKFGSVSEDYLDGALDDVKMYNYALSSREVAEKYRQGSPSLAQGGTITNDTYIMNSGKMGIGTATPYTLLNVSGTSVANYGQFSISAGAAADAMMTFYTDAYKAYIQYDDDVDDFIIQNQNAGSFGDLVLNPFGGNVGIGTTNPGQKLEINGDIKITGDDIFMATNTSGYLLIADGTNYNPTAVSGDITISGAGATIIGADKILESMLKVVDAAADEECLTYETTTGDFEWQACGAGGVPTVITVADTTDTTSFVALFEDATGDLGPKTDAGITYNAGTGMLTATGFTGPLTGNVTGNVSGTAATVTGAAQANITSLGTLTILTVDDITINGNTISSAGASTLAITPTAGQSITFDGTVTLDAGVIAGATSITSTSFVGALTGNASTATALAADPADCAANNFATGIDASGALTCSTIDISASTNLAAGRSLTMSGDSVEADAELFTDTKCIWWENPVATDDFKSIWFAKQAATVTSLWCESDQTTTLMGQVDDGTPADMDTVDLTCDATPPEDTALDGDATLAAGERIDLDVASVSGTPTWISFCWTFEYSD